MRRAGLISLLAALALAVLAPGEAAAARKGTTAIDLGGSGLASLRAQHVRITALRPARVVGGVMRLPVTGGLVTSGAYLNHGGGLRLRRRVHGRRRSVSITELQVRLGADARVIATVGDRRLTAFRIVAPASDVSLNARNGSASLRGARVTFTRAAGVAIKRALKLRRRPGGAFGEATVEALVMGTGGGGSGAPGSPPGGGGPPAPGPLWTELPVLARPSTAVDVSGLALTWYPRDSWLRYLNTSTATGDGVHATDGAVAGPASEASACPDAATPTNPGFPYSFDFTPTSGWYDPPSGAAGLYFHGAVSFRWKDHGIDLTASDPEIEVTGSSRAIFRFSGSGGTPYPNQRAALVTLAAAPHPGVTGGPIAYELARGGLTEDGASVFAGFYPVGAGFGCVTASFTAP